MGAWKLAAVAWIVISIALIGVRAEEAAAAEAAEAAPEVVEAPEVAEKGEVADSGLRLELQELRTKISALESSIVDRNEELKKKDEGIAQLEKVIEEKAKTISSLQSEKESLQKKGAVAEEAGKAFARASELEKQIEELKAEIESQNKKRNTLEDRANVAEKKIQELNLKLDGLQKTSEEQKKRIQKIERALQVAEEELMKAQLEATSKSKELTEVHGAWLPPWLATHIGNFQGIVVTHWEEHLKPAYESFVQKALEKSRHAQKWAEPHLETAKTKWIPAVKEQWAIFLTNAEPHVRMVSLKSVEFYEASKTAIAPHVVRIQEFADPYFQEAKKFSKPYIDQVAEITKPHVEKVRVALKPYTKKVVRSYRKLLKSANTYHHQVQLILMENLKKHELTKSLAIKELVWFMASALLAFPVFFLYRLLSDIFCTKKARRPARKSHTHVSHASRRPKRRHADK